jgi:hypothetical protein
MDQAGEDTRIATPQASSKLIVSLFCRSSIRERQAIDNTSASANSASGADGTTPRAVDCSIPVSEQGKNKPQRTSQHKFVGVGQSCQELGQAFSLPRHS